MPPNLVTEAVKITEDLGRVVFVGALALGHYGAYRTTGDIDLAIASLDERKLASLGYTRWQSGRSSWITPRGVKADFYTRDVGGIPVTWILEKSVPVTSGKKSYRVICLEGLVLAKHRAGRTTDIDDLRQLLTRQGKMINWDLMVEIAKPLEITELKQIAMALAR